MLRGIVVFLVVALLVHGGWQLWKAATWKERLTALKNVMYNLLVAAMAVAVLAVIVILF